MRRARDAAGAELAAELDPGLLHRVRAREAAQHPREQQQHDSAERRQQRRGELQPVGIVHAEPAHELALALGVVAEHQQVPLVRERLPVVAQRAQPLHVGPHDQRQRAGGRDRARQAFIQAPRHRQYRRIHANPSAVHKIDLGPGVRVGLAHGEAAVHRVQVAALVADDHARRHAGGAHQEHEGRREVFAEALVRVEQELVHRIAAEQARLGGVLEALEAEMLDRARQHLRVAAGGRAPAPGERHGARVEAGRQAQRAIQVAGVFLCNRVRLGARHHLVAHARADWRQRHDLAVVQVARARRQQGGGFQREQPVAVVRLEQYRVFDARAVARLGQLGKRRRADAPGAAVEIPQHRPAPVERAPRRQVFLEVDAEGDRIRQRELRQVAGRHRLGQPADRAVGILRQPPQRSLHAREQQEEDQRGGHCLPDQQRRGAQVGARRAPRRGQPDQRRDAGGHRRQHPQRCRDRLRVEEIRDGEEPDEEHHRRRVALVA